MDRLPVHICISYQLVTASVTCSYMHLVPAHTYMSYLLIPVFVTCSYLYLLCAHTYICYLLITKSVICSYLYIRYLLIPVSVTCLHLHLLCLYMRQLHRILFPYRCTEHFINIDRPQQTKGFFKNSLVSLYNH